MDDARAVIQLLTAQKKTLATAESCTGGLLGAKLTAVPGASAVYLGGIISYAYELKERFLGVDPQLLKEKGAICPEVAEQMARGALKSTGADYAISLTGNAGPGTDPLNPNVGEIYVALAWGREVCCKALKLQGNREENREAACKEALSLLLTHINP